jgi:cytochrome oxidase Cu insertion factor (SCO1/SenC/PrrC family)
MMRHVLPLLLPLAACVPQAPGTGDPTDRGDAAAEVCGPGADIGLEVGQCAPDFTLPDAAGQPFTLSAQRGKVALVDISAVW